MTHPDTVRRLVVKFGYHADRFHDQQAQDLEISTLEMDVREASPIKALASWSMAVYNWVRPHRSLRQKLAVPEGKRQY